jgi:hypothetical protein
VSKKEITDQFEESFQQGTKVSGTITGRFEHKRTAPRIDFYHNAMNKVRPWTCSIRLPDGEFHGGEGTTQCEALMLACINWAMHGTTK